MSRPKSITKASPYTPTRGQFAGQTFTSQRQYDNARAAAKGFKNANALLRIPKPAKSVNEFRNMSARESQKFNASQEIINRFRDGRAPSLTKAIADYNHFHKKNRISRDTVWQYSGGSLSKGANGRIVVGNDSLTRTMDFIGPTGSYDIEIRGNTDASMIAQYKDAVELMQDTGNTEPLNQFKGKYITDIHGKKHAFITDPDLLERLEDAGEIDHRRYVS